MTTLGILGTSTIALATVTACFPGPIPASTVDASTNVSDVTTADDTASPTPDAVSDSQHPLDTIAECDAERPCPGSTNPCLVAQCASGRCVMTPNLERPTCDDDDPCTDGDRCDTGGQCVGTAKSCDDARACTIDGCAPATGACVHDASACHCDDDGDCDDDNACTDDHCDTAQGECTNVPRTNAECDDGLRCTTEDRCDAEGVCLGVALDCADERVCTADRCDPDTGACTHDDAACACDVDGDCDDAAACSVDECQVSEGRCDYDRAACECVVAADCDDQNPCTVDSCSGVQRCERVVADNGIPCPDGVCVDGACDQEVAHVLAGTAKFGCGRASGCDTDATPIRTVDLPGFLVDRREVTARRYAECVAAAACTEPATGTATLRTYGSPFKLDHPVNYVSQTQAAAYCAWRGKRLCSETEWEKAARGATGFDYAWGNSPDPTCERAVMNDGGTGGCGTGQTAAVGSRPSGASPYGLLDVLGNVSEWVADCYTSNLVNVPSDGSPYTSSCSYRVTKGGSYGTQPFDLFVHRRVDVAGYVTLPDVGFRCCRGL